MTQVWSNGGGTQSAAIAGLICEGKLPRPDIAVISDTEREASATWEYLDNVIRPKLWESQRLEVIRIKKSDWYTEDDPDVLTEWGDDGVLIPAFKLTPDGDRAKMIGRCSDRWKTQPIRRWLRAQGVTECRAWLGMSRDELHRVRESGLKWYRHHFPLIFDVPMRRGECISYVADHLGWPEPPRSACWMCPNRHSREWVQLRDNNPVEFQRAVEFDKWLRTERPGFYLHESLVQLDNVDFSAYENQPSLLDKSCSSGYCFV